MKLFKLVVPAALIAMLALFATRAGAQTMGEYATTTAGVGTGSSSMGTAVSTSVASTGDGGGSSTWAPSGLGANFDQRAGSSSSSGAGVDFESRAGSSSAGLSSAARWPQPELGSNSASRFSDSSRFSSQDRFTENSEWSSGSADRFPASSFNDNRNGLDTTANAINNF